MLAAIRQKHPTIPIGLLMYANLVFHKGIDAFYQRCAEVGVDSVLVADVPFEESAPFRAAAAAVSHRSSSARRTPMTIYCVKSRHTAAATPTCCRAPG